MGNQDAGKMPQPQGYYDVKNVEAGLVKEFRSELIFNLFYKIFDVVHAETDAQKEAAHRLRYQVFCVENQGFEDPSAHPDGLETDEFDSMAEHVLLIYKATGEAVGTCRIIKPKEDDWASSFPLQNICSSPLLHDENYVKNSCEFSRFCLSREKMNRIREELTSKNPLFSKGDGRFTFYEKPLLKIALSMASLGIIRGVFELAMKHQLLNVFAVMEPRHLSRMEQAGLVHEQIGPEVNYHGIRRPFMCNILEVLDNAIVNNHDIWKVVSVKGLNHRLAREIYDLKMSMAKIAS